jgi:hypothetical protein
MKALVGAAGVVALLSVTALVHAQERQPSAAEIRVAAEAFDLGRAAYTKQEYVAAAEHFEKADRNAPSATALELAIRSRQSARQLDRAATMAALALDRHPFERELRALAEAVLAKASGDLHAIVVTCEEACELSVSDRAVHGRGHTRVIVYAVPGQLTVQASWRDGRSAAKEVAATEAGGTSEVHFLRVTTAKPVASDPRPEPDVGPEAVSPAEPDARPEQQDPKTDSAGRGWSPVVFWVGAGLTAAAGGVTVWSGLDTLNNPGTDKVKEVCVDTDCPEYQEGLANQRRTNILIGATAGIGALTIVVGAFLTDWGGKKEAARVLPRDVPRVGAWLSVTEDGNGVALGARGRF